MLTDVCQELRNWFDRNQAKWFGKFEIQNGVLVGSENMLKEGQYYRIIGSTMNDGVYLYSADVSELVDESFCGAVWLMAVPPAVVRLSQDIDDWMLKYGGVDSQAMSPYTSESFGGYSYSKSTGGYSGYGDGSGNTGWKAVFADRLNRWRKI